MTNVLGCGRCGDWNGTPLCFSLSVAIDPSTSKSPVMRKSVARVNEEAPIRHPSQGEPVEDLQRCLRLTASLLCFHIIQSEENTGYSSQMVQKVVAARLVFSQPKRAHHPSVHWATLAPYSCLHQIQISYARQQGVQWVSSNLRTLWTLIKAYVTLWPLRSSGDCRRAIPTPRT